MNDSELKEMDIFITESLTPLKKQLIAQLKKNFEFNETYFIKNAKKRIEFLEKKIKEFETGKHLRTKQNYEVQLVRQKVFLEDIEKQQVKLQQSIARYESEEKAIKVIVEKLKKR